MLFDVKDEDFYFYVDRLVKTMKEVKDVDKFLHSIALAMKQAKTKERMNYLLKELNGQ